MRGTDVQQNAMFSYVSPEQRVPADHPIRELRQLTDAVLQRLSKRFAAMYAVWGRPSIPPEKLLRALLLQILYTVRSERQLMEQLDYNLLFRWFVGLNLDEPVWDASTFSKNRERLLQGDVAEAFFDEVLREAGERDLLSREHFTVDGTLLEAWASHKSFQKKKGGTPSADGEGGNPSVDFQGEVRSNQTHESKTDPGALLARKAAGREAKLSYHGHLLTENRHGLIVNTRLTQATGKAEREAALAMVQEIPGSHRVTLGGDRNYDVKEFVADLRARQVTPHVAQRKWSAIDGRTTQREGYGVSQKKRKRVEECFGWMKTIGLLRKLRHRGLERVGWVFTFTAAAYNLVRIRNLLPVLG
ncbi:MAG: IS5 family transposase [Acidobacteria bacterium]|nr:IS5 family transposase [Acidobacteriota bacterium]